MFCHAFMLEAGLATRSRKAGDFGQTCSAAETTEWLGAHGKRRAETKFYGFLPLPSLKGNWTLRLHTESTHLYTAGGLLSSFSIKQGKTSNLSAADCQLLYFHENQDISKKLLPLILITNVSPSVLFVSYGYSYSWIPSYKNFIPFHFTFMSPLGFFESPTIFTWGCFILHPNFLPAQLPPTVLRTEPRPRHVPRRCSLMHKPGRRSLMLGCTASCCTSPLSYFLGHQFTVYCV